MTERGFKGDCVPRSILKSQGNFFRTFFREICGDYLDIIVDIKVYAIIDINENHYYDS